MKRWTLYVAGAAALVVGLVACPQFAPDDVCGYPGFCADGAVDGGGKDVTQDGPSVCPSGKEPKDDPTCVADALGIFVAPSPTGNDANAGTKAAPVASLKAALAKVGGKSFIFVCEGNYTESVDIKQSASIYGGFKCTGWTYSGALPKFTGTKSDYVLHLDTANDTIIADLELDAIDATPNTGASSIGAFVATSQNVTFERVTIHAGKGADGPSGTLTSYTYPDAGALNGNSSTSNSGGGSNTVPCPGGLTTVGGAGGDTGLDGQNGLPALDGGTHGDAGLNNTNSFCTVGSVGATGVNGVDGTPSAAPGTVSADAGWTPSGGGDGKQATPGQGGGGGGGQVAGGSSGGGGGGGAGGCGGAGGGGGKSGGASAGIATIDSAIVLRQSVVACATAGAGGNGVTGQVGQANGVIGGVHGNGFMLGCQGGNGGVGGTGGGGAGGNGGVSIGVLSKGGTVNIDSATQSNITVAPQGGTKGTGAAGNDGIAGVAQPTLAL